MNVYYANCKYENWDACIKNEIFGLKGRLPNLESGDLILLRVTGHSGQPYGVRAIWRFEEVDEVNENSFVPWTDGEYKWILRCTPLVQFKTPFSEEFATSSKLSQKINSLYATRIMGSIGALKPIEAIEYIEGILEEKSDELQAKVPDEETDLNSYAVLKDVSTALQTSIGYKVTSLETRRLAEEAVTVKSKQSYGVVGERIDLPILNYAPLNEAGVVLLFGYYLKDLGFSHLEEIRAGFPDAIGMQKIDDHRYQRVRIEFEFKSRNFVAHGHNTEECDVIVCWEHDWPESPLEVIELRSELFTD